MSASLEGIQVKISLELQGWFETTVPITVNSVTVGSGIELNQYFSSRILSDTDGNGTIEPVQGPNGLLDGWLKVDISGNQVFAQFSGQAQPTGIKIKIENLAPTGAAPGTVEMAGQMNGVNTVYAPTYTASTKVLELNWFLLGFQPGTVINQTVFYDNMLDDAPVAVDDSFAINVGQTLSGANILANDTDLDNLGNFGIVDISTVTKINSVNLNPNQWIDLQGGGQIKVSSSGQLQFREDGDFTDLARGVTRTTSFQYTIADSTGLTAVGIRRQERGDRRIRAGATLVCGQGAQGKVGRLLVYVIERNRHGARRIDYAVAIFVVNADEEAEGGIVLEIELAAIRHRDRSGRRVDRERAALVAGDDGICQAIIVAEGHERNHWRASRGVFINAGLYGRQNRLYVSN